MCRGCVQPCRRVRIGLVLHGYGVCNRNLANYSVVGVGGWVATAGVLVALCVRWRECRCEMYM